MKQLDSFHRLASILTGEQLLNEQQQVICILTGSRGTGKTTFCNNIIHKYQMGRLSIRGVLSPARFDGGRKTGIYLKDVQTGRQRLLGKDVADKEYSKKVGCWNFSPEVLRWGNECLRRAAGSDVIIFDESGSLELEHGKGFQSGLNLFDNKSFKLGVVGVRPSLLTMAQARWPEAMVIDMEKELA